MITSATVWSLLSAAKMLVITNEQMHLPVGLCELSIRLIRMKNCQKKKVLNASLIQFFLKTHIRAKSHCKQKLKLEVLIDILGMKEQ